MHSDSFPFRFSQNHRALWIAIGFTLLLWIFEQSFLPFQTQTFPELYSSVANVTISAVSTALIILFFWVSFSSNTLVRIISLSMFALSLITEYGYCFAMGRFSIIQDYQIGFGAVNSDLIINAILSFLNATLTALLPIGFYTGILIWTRKDRKASAAKMIFVLICILIFYSVIFPFSRGTFPTVSFNAGLRTTIFTGWDRFTAYRGPRKTVNPSSQPVPVNNIIFIVDESVRCDHLSLNGYSRPTTPFLDELQKNGSLYNWGPSSSNGTSSLNANLMLVTGIKELPDVEQNIWKQPTIFQYAKSARYSTFLIDVQMNKLWQMRESDLGFVDHWVRPEDFTGGVAEQDLDLAAAKIIRKTVENSTGNFIWINKMGLHFPYPTRFPKSKAIWQPVLQSDSYDYQKKEELINSYDNGLAYNLDNFFRILMGSDGLPEDTIIIYTSDHGQTLSEHGESWPHSGSTRNEACVPLLIVSPRQLHVDTTYKASHANIFPTLLDLMQVPEENRTYPYAISLLSAKSSDTKPRHYLFGTLTSFSSSEVLDFDP
jgi:glucan phosphoethanolaminetransferase (alkaline phosphatase superfamily)